MKEEDLNYERGWRFVRQQLHHWSKDLQSSIGFLTRLPWPWQTSPHKEHNIDVDTGIYPNPNSNNNTESLNTESDSLADNFTSSGEKKLVLGQAVRAFPVVGLFIGLASGVIFAISSGLGLPAIVSALIAIAIGTLLTGALHEDGLADTADGFGGGRSKNDKLAVMKDSRIGAYGVLALLLVIAIKVGAIADLETIGETMCALIAAGATSRALMPTLMHWLPPARIGGLSAMAGKPEKKHVFTGLSIAIVISLILLGWPAIIALLAAGTGALIVASIAQKQIGGQTGDVLGATQQVSELFFLLALAAVL